MSVLKQSESRSEPILDRKKGIGRFPTCPDLGQLKKIQEWIAKTGAPEDHPDLCLADLDPADSEQHYERVIDIDFDASKRPYDVKAYCVVCRKWKFYDGCLIWCEGDGTLRPVGNRCGGTHFGKDRWKEMGAEQDWKMKVDWRTDYLVEILPTIPMRLDGLGQMLAYSQRIQDEHHELFRDAPILMGIMANIAKRHNGELTVSIERDVEAAKYGPSGFRSGGEDSKYVTETVGHLSGRQFLVKSYKPVASLAEARKELLLLSYQGGSTDDEILDRLSKLSDKEIVSLGDKIQKALEQAASVENRIMGAARFLSEGNFRLIEKWCNHPDGPNSVDVSVKNGVMALREHGSIRRIVIRSIKLFEA